MLITVTTATQSLWTEILSDAQKAIIAKSKNYWAYWRNIIIQNLWAQNIYVEFAGAAAVASWIQIAASGWILSFPWTDLSEVNLIADWGSNTNVRVWTK